MKIKIFGKSTCDACKSTKEKFQFFIKKWDLENCSEIVFYDLDTIDGLVEGSMQNAMDIPTTILEKEGKEVARWEKAVPSSLEFKKHFFEINNFDMTAETADVN